MSRPPQARATQPPPQHIDSGAPPKLTTAGKSSMHRESASPKGNQEGKR